MTAVQEGFQDPQGDLSPSPQGYDNATELILAMSSSIDEKLTISESGLL